jgi:hypothetical protein
MSTRMLVMLPWIRATNGWGDPDAGQPLGDAAIDPEEVTTVCPALRLEQGRDVPMPDASVVSMSNGATLWVALSVDQVRERIGR